MHDEGCGLHQNLREGLRKSLHHSTGASPPKAGNHFARPEDPAAGLSGFAFVLICPIGKGLN